MVLIRQFEERSAELYTMGKIGGFCHLYSGQEAVAVGACAAMRRGDSIITSYRSRGHLLSLGADPVAVMAELMGRSHGSSKGRGGSMHIFSTEKSFFGGNGIVGAQISLGTGLGFAHKYKKDGSVCLVFFGDGASNQGQFFESMNMAALWKLPVLYVIENNLYGMGTAVARSCAGELFRRGEPFGIPGHVVDGSDVIVVHNAMDEALARIRETSMPVLLEIKTYRFRGHSMSDQGHYRTRGEVEQSKQTLDPIQKLAAVLLTRGVSPESLERIVEEIDREIDRIVEESEKGDNPDPENLEQFVYAL